METRGKRVNTAALLKGDINIRSKVAIHAVKPVGQPVSYNMRKSDGCRIEAAQVQSWIYSSFTKFSNILFLYSTHSARSLGHHAGPITC